MKKEIWNNTGQQGNYSIPVGKCFNRKQTNLGYDDTDKYGFECW